MIEKDDGLEAITKAMEFAMGLCANEEDHDDLDLVLKRWRSRFDMLLEENTRKMSNLKMARRLAGR